MAEQEKEKRGIWSRRDFFTRLGWGGFGIFGGLSLLGFLRSAFPRVLFQPPATFKAGLPNDYAIGEVSEKYKQDQRVWIVREEPGSTRSSPNARTSAARRAGWPRKTSSNAPVTAAAFSRRGLNFEGPAPRPLDRFRITVGDDGQLVVDKSKVFKMGRRGRAR